MKTYLIIFFTFLVLSSSLIAQAPDTLWTRTFGGSDDDGCYDGQQVTGGGYIMTGYTRSFGNSSRDIWLIKTDESGNALWSKTYGGIADDRGYSVNQTDDGGYIITGNTLSLGAGSYDLWLLKTDASGDTLWTKTYGGILEDGGRSVQQTSDGGYVIAGSTWSFGAGLYDIWLLKTNAFGDTLWTKTFGGNLHDGGRAVQQTFDGGYIITGYTFSFSFGASDIWLIKTDAYGNKQWEKTFGSTIGDEGYAIQQTIDSGYILTGISEGNVFLLKTDSLGNESWSKSYGGSNEDISFSVNQTNEFGYILVGYTLSFGSGTNDIWIIKTDSSGDTLWTKILGGYISDRGYSIQQTNDGGYIIFGFTGSFGAGGGDVWLVRLESQLNTNVTINFFPTVDTAYINGGCCTPAITARNHSTNSSLDSISIEPSSNSIFYYIDSTGTLVNVDNYFFIVIDSLNEFDYELWYYPKANDNFDPIVVPFDSTYFIDYNNFDFQLIVKRNGEIIDSLSQPFHADFGLGIESNYEFPDGFCLHQNYPNPFNPSTTIRFTISELRFTTLKIYDLLGREVATLVNEEKSAGEYEVEFVGEALTSGIYFYQLRAGEYTETKKMVLIK